MLYLDKKLTGKTLAACFEVINELGAGFLESVYERALIFALGQKGLTVIDQAPIEVTFRKQKVGQFYADILVENKVIVEIKALIKLLPEHKAQVINYLKASRFDVGLLVNFGNPKLEYKRLYK
jgi:GxxExxY protein